MIWISTPTLLDSQFTLLSDTDNYHNALSSTCPPSPEDKSDLEQVAGNTPSQDLAFASDVCTSTPWTLTTVHVITPWVMIMIENLEQNHQTVIVSSSKCKMLSPRLKQPIDPQPKGHLLDFKNHQIVPKSWNVYRYELSCFIYNCL